MMGYDFPNPNQKATGGMSPAFKGQAKTSKSATPQEHHSFSSIKQKYFTSCDPTMTFIHFVTGKSFGILSDIFSGIRSGIYTFCYWQILWHSI